MNPYGWYYLHKNGDLIFKKYRPEDDSTFVQKIWPCVVENRETAWTIVIEAIAMGAKLRRIRELSKKWSLDTKDLREYLVRAEPTPLRNKGIDLFLREVCGVNPDEWFDNEAKEASDSATGGVLRTMPINTTIWPATGDRDATNTSNRRD